MQWAPNWAQHRVASTDQHGRQVDRITRRVQGGTKLMICGMRAKMMSKLPYKGELDLGGRGGVEVGGDPEVGPQIGHNIGSQAPISTNQHQSTPISTGTK